MPKPRTGTLVQRKSGWFVILSLDVDGVTIRKSVDLQTQIKAVAKRKAARLAAQHQRGAVTPQDVAATTAVLETYREAATRIRALRRAQNLRDVHNEESRDKVYVL